MNNEQRIEFWNVLCLLKTNNPEQEWKQLQEKIILPRFLFRYCQNESRAIVLLCTQRGKWVHFVQAVFRQIFAPGVAAKEDEVNYSYSRVHLPFRIRILQGHKEKD